MIRLERGRRKLAAEVIEDLATVEALVAALPVGGTEQPDGAPDSGPLALALEVLRQSVMSLLRPTYSLRVGSPPLPEWSHALEIAEADA